MVCELEDLLQRNVDLVVEGSLLPFAAASAEHDKKLIYERAKLATNWKAVLILLENFHKVHPDGMPNQNSSILFLPNNHAYGM